MHYRRGVSKLEVVPTTVVSATPSVFVPQELVESANAQVQLDALSSAIPLIHPSSLISSGPVDPADVQVQAAMSKTQYQLTVEEGKLWEKLTDPDEVVDYDESTVAAILAFLREKSSFMVQSYLRRNNPPTEITYNESKNILHAMGVPCIESTGPYEAEALASSLVLNGCADYVASEDTVRAASPPLSPISSKFSGSSHPTLFCPYFSTITLTYQLPPPTPSRTCSSTERLSSGTSRTETRHSCSSRVPRCTPRSASTRAPLLTSRSSSERTSPPASGTLGRTERCIISASTARSSASSRRKSSISRASPFRRIFRPCETREMSLWSFRLCRPHTCWNRKNTGQGRLLQY